MRLNSQESLERGRNARWHFGSWQAVREASLHVPRPTLNGKSDRGSNPASR